MKSIIYILVSCIVICVSEPVQACDGCGGNIGLSLNSLLNVNNSSFLSMRWDRATFVSTETSDHDIHDRFDVLQLVGRYRIDSRFAVLASVPYVNNGRVDGAIDQGLSGLGDATIGVTYAVINEARANTSIYAELGARVKLPTGKYEEALHNIDLPQNFNVGTGGVGYIGTASVAAKGQSSGLVYSMSYSYEGRSPNGYKFGSSWLSRLTAYKSQSLGGELTLVGVAGLQYEDKAKEQYKTQVVVESSGGRGLFVPLSLGLSMNGWVMQSEVALPLYQNFINNELNSNPKWSVQLIYFIK